jgi:isopentenyl diphosphate isomerase/L-lactate dehydrogenase-like FMN-dependent dehydrogenase
MQTTNRRRFLRLLAASPLLGLSGLTLAPLAKTAGYGKDARLLDAIEHFTQTEDLIATSEQALNVMEFESVARKKLPPAHFGYLATGVNDDGTLRANRAGFEKFQLRVRRMRDVQNLDTSVRLFGGHWHSPLILAPVGSQKAFHPEGEIATARAARAKGHLKILSTNSSSSIESVIAAHGGPVWFQLYLTNDWNVARGLIKRAEAAGCPALVVTVDSQGGANRETLAKYRRMDSRNCADCHAGGFGYSQMVRRRPMFEGLDVSKVTSLLPENMSWDVIKRLKDTTRMKLVLKGIVTREDAELAVTYGVDGIIVSNHGGRNEDSNRGTIECLPEVIAGVAGKVPVLIDGGFRRGTDIFKALALGANAVCVGRPYLWGLAAFGQAGVESVLAILQRELQMVMRQAGTSSIEKITHEYLTER